MDGENYHKETKAEDFKDVNTVWKGIRLLMFTGTLTCGVDYSPEDPADNFDTFVNVFQYKCSVATQFIQSFCRCRTYKDTQHILYLQHVQNSMKNPITPRKIWESHNATKYVHSHKYKLVNNIHGFKYVLDARRNQVINQATEYIFSRLQMLGYALEYQDLNTFEYEKTKRVELLKDNTCHVTQDVLNFYYKNHMNGAKALEDYVTDKPTLNSIITHCVFAKALKITDVTDLYEAVNNPKIVKHTDQIRQLIYITKTTDYKTVLDFIPKLDELHLYQELHEQKTMMNLKADKAANSALQSIEKLFTNLYKLKKGLQFIKTHETFKMSELLEVMDIGSTSTLTSIANTALISLKFENPKILVDGVWKRVITNTTISRLI